MRRTSIIVAAGCLTALIHAGLKVISVDLPKNEAQSLEDYTKKHGYLSESDAVNNMSGLNCGLTDCLCSTKLWFRLCWFGRAS